MYVSFCKLLLSSTVNYEIQSMSIIKYVLTFESTQEIILSSDHSDEGSASVLSQDVFSCFQNEHINKMCLVTRHMICHRVFKRDQPA